jgi:type IV pilus assembly protein PilX
MPPLAARGQRGFVLVMSLIFLVLLTIIGITVMNTTVLQEKMAFNVKDKNLSLQASESGLALAEKWIGSVQGQPNVGNIVGTYWTENSGTSPIWKSVDWTNTTVLCVYPNDCSGNPFGTALDGNFYAGQPRYIVEYVGKQSKSLQIGGSGTSQSTYYTYRVTSRGVGGTVAAASMAQTTYNKK